MKIAVLGTKGMLAHVMIDVLSETHDVTGISLRNRTIFETDLNSYDVVINCIGILVNESELRRDRATYYNTFLPHYLAHNIPGKLIHISTDCVFDDTFYGKTKLLGEVNNSRHVTLRTSIIGPELNPNGTGLFNWFMRQNTDIDGYKQAIWSGITTLQLAKSIDEVINKDIGGIYNLTTDGIDKFSLLVMLNEIFYKFLKITPIEEGEDKSLPGGGLIELPDYKTQIQEMKGWIDEQPERYSHYVCQ